MMKILISTFILFLVVSCTTLSQVGSVHILKYSDFGPPAMANELIGMDWWQWQNHGDSRPRSYNIKVVVYRGLKLNDVKNKFPINQSKNLDYRYLDYHSAMKYLNEHIQDNVFESLTVKLLSTKKIIVEYLGDI